MAGLINEFLSRAAEPELGRVSSEIIPQVLRKPCHQACWP